MCFSFWARKAAISGAFPEIPLQLNWRILGMTFDCSLWELLQRGLWARIGCGNCYLVRGEGWGFGSVLRLNESRIAKGAVKISVMFF